MDPSWIPPLNATLNAISTAFLTAGFLLIRRGQVHAHRTCMLSALAVSALFLVGYIAHKVLVDFQHTSFPGEGFWALFYYVMLFTHIVLAAAILPLILVTLRFAWQGRFERHRAWARWTFPAWYYVSVTGVLVYFFLYQWFDSSA